MMTMIRAFPFFLAALLTAQPVPDKDLTIDASERKTAIDGVLQALDKRYVIPEVAKKMESAIRDRQTKGEYDNVTSAAEFARLLTVAAPTIPDELFERLRVRFGEKQVAAMVTRILDLAETPKPADAADALALAICHLWRGGPAVVTGLPGSPTSAQQQWREAAEAASRGGRRRRVPAGAAANSQAASAGAAAARAAARIAAASAAAAPRQPGASQRATTVDRLR